jgi:alanine dehydrogenase
MPAHPRGTLAFGLPCLHKEPGERRAFLPPLVARLSQLGASLALEDGYGSGMGLSQDDYLHPAPTARFVTREEAYQQPYVLVLRCPSDDEIRSMRAGACLISMLHYPTRPQRVAFLRERGLEAVSLDSIKDDSGRRLIENLRAVAWNGIEAAFQTLRKTYPAPGLDNPDRDPIRVTLLGAGAVGGHAVHAAVRYGDERLRQHLAGRGVPGVQVTVVDYDLTDLPDYMAELLARTDLLIDATQRPDPSRPLIPNAWIAHLPDHAVILDLSVDPYDPSRDPAYVKGIEGIPQGNLDQYVFTPDDPAYDAVPHGVSTRHRRHVVSCYSWPGVHPRVCMQVYGGQLQPILRALVEQGGVQGIDPRGRFFQRAIARAVLSRWEPPPQQPNHAGAVAGSRR